MPDENNMPGGKARTLRCPQCGAAVSAENVNIQRLVALCPACDTVFTFDDIAAEKAKRRKFKQPEKLIARDDGQRLILSYPQRLGANDRKGLFISIVMTCLSAFIAAVMAAEGGDAAVFFGPVGLISMVMFLTTALAVLFNRRQVTVDADTILTRQGPLPIPLPGEDWLFAEQSLPHHDVLRVYCEQTEESRKAGGLKRHYHVCLALPDGERIFLLKAVPQAYAFYIAQEVEAYLANLSGEETITDIAALRDDIDEPAHDSGAGGDTLRLAEDGELPDLSDMVRRQDCG